MPPIFSESYLGLSVGWPNFPFTQDNLVNGFTAQKIESPNVAPRIFIGHFLNPYLAAQISLMRPIQWVRFSGVQYPNDNHTVWISLFGITLRPTLPISNKFSLYGDIGLGLISRHGFRINDVSAINNAFISTLLTGGGITYALNQRWHLDLGISYALQNTKKEQPHIFYAYTGFYYLLSRDPSDKHYSKEEYFFPLNFIQLGFFNNNLFYENLNKYVTEGGLPIFWDGKIKNKNGVYLMYERNFFHTDRTFSLEWGASISRYQTQQQGQLYYAISLFPALKVWIIRSKIVDFYFTYSVAGPSYISRDSLDHVDVGGHFIFQDFMGIGFFLGKKKNFNINLKIGHYSNGNLFPENAGIEVPLTIAVGFTF